MRTRCHSHPESISRVHHSLRALEVDNVNFTDDILIWSTLVSNIASYSQRIASYSQRCIIYSLKGKSKNTSADSQLHTRRDAVRLSSALDCERAPTRHAYVMNRNHFVLKYAGSESRSDLVIVFLRAHRSWRHAAASDDGDSVLSWVRSWRGRARAEPPRPGKRFARIAVIMTVLIQMCASAGSAPR